MTAAQKHLGIVVLLLSCAAAQNPSPLMVRKVTTTRQGSDLRIEITVSAPVKPEVDTAVNPDRILLDFPNTICNNSTQKVAVHANGVRQVRTAQHSTAPYVTRVVLDLDEVRPYVVTAEGNRIILTVSGEEKVSHGAPVAATSGNILAGVFRHHDGTAPVIGDDSKDSAPPLPPPPPAVSGPDFQPSASNSSAASLPAPPPAVAQPQPAAAPSTSTPPATSAQNEIAPAPKPDTAAEVIPSSPLPTAPASTQPTEKPVEMAAVPAPPQPQPAAAAPSTSTPPATSAQNEIAVAPKPDTAAGVIPSSPPPTAPASIQPAEKPVEMAAVPAPPQPQPAAVPTEVPPPPTSAPAAAAVEAAVPQPIEPPAEAVATPTAPAPGTVEIASAPVEAAPAATSNPAESADASSSPAEPNPAPVTTLIARSDDPSLHTVFRVKYVGDGVAYLEGGRRQGLSEGMKLMVVDANHAAKQGESVNAADPKVAAELEVSAVADTSAVTDIHNPKRPVKVGDLAYLSNGDTETLVEQRTLSSTRQYPAVISFTEGDTLDEDVRQEVPRPPSPAVNRARGRIGFDMIETWSHGTSTVTSRNLGLVFRGDITRIGGTYWNLSGYWRGRVTRESAAVQNTLQETLNRTYHLNLTYDNPNSPIVAGFGRLYLPWAPSLDTIDGGYFGVHLSKGTILGVFGGSTPDPSSWDYSPNRVLSGTFVNFEGGEYNTWHYSTTFGGGISMIKWQLDRPLAFVEDSISYKRIIALYESAQVDDPSGNSVTASPGFGLGRNFTTLRINPVARVELDGNYNYFRDVPTFDTILVGTGLLDKFLFQGFSAGGRVEVLPQIWISSQLGRSSRSGDTKSSLNQMYGLTFGRVPIVKLRVDVHYSRFNSSFGDGHYESLSLSRQVSDHLRLEALLGQQDFGSKLTAGNRSRFLTGTVETVLGPHYYLQGNFTTNRGDLKYDQLMLSLGYRFDNRRKRE